MAPRVQHKIRYSRDNLITSTCPGKQKPRGVVLLLGWYGSQHRHLEKYSTLYETEFQMQTVNVIATDEALYWNKSGLRELARDSLRITIEKSQMLGGCPIVIHIFSNGGGFLYSQILKLFVGSSMQPSGLVLDSCPGELKISSFLSAFSATRPPMWLKGIVFSMAAAIPTIAWYSIFNLMRCFFPTSLTIPGIIASLTILALYLWMQRASQKLTSSYWRKLEESEVRCPECYMYSPDDQLVSHIGIQRLASIRKELGIDVVQMSWAPSAHVSHLVHHRKGYIEALRVSIIQKLPSPLQYGHPDIDS